MTSGGSHYFELSRHDLFFDGTKNILVCKNRQSGTTRWAAKIEDIVAIDGILEDESRFYCSCVSDFDTGYYIALDIDCGETIWFIPGRAFFHTLFRGGLYAIFIDESKAYYLISINRKDGSKIWHYRVEDELVEYRFSGDRLVLGYLSGRSETISLLDGTLHTEVRHNA